LTVAPPVLHVLGRLDAFGPKRSAIVGTRKPSDAAVRWAQKLAQDAAAAGMDEVHQGSKNIVFDDADGQRWMVTHHFGTAGLARACTRFHTVGIGIRRAIDGLLLADLHFMGDFGSAVVNRTQEPLTPPSCPDQFAEAQADPSTGIRQLPARSAGSVFYEPWRSDSADNMLGLTGTFTVNATDAIVICNTIPRSATGRSIPATTATSASSRRTTASVSPLMATPARSILTPRANG
jgi:hypothetical protein